MYKNGKCIHIAIISLGHDLLSQVVSGPGIWGDDPSQIYSAFENIHAPSFSHVLLNCFK